MSELTSFQCGGAGVMIGPDTPTTPVTLVDVPGSYLQILCQPLLESEAAQEASRQTRPKTSAELMAPRRSKMCPLTNKPCPYDTPLKKQR